MRTAALALLLISSVSTPALAQLAPPQNSRPVPTAKTDTIPAARDIAYPGTMQLTVDASDVTRAIFRVHQRIPVAKAGDFVPALSQEVDPGGHSPRGDIKDVTGIRFAQTASRSGGCATRSTSRHSTSTCRRA